MCRLKKMRDKTLSHKPERVAHGRYASARYLCSLITYIIRALGVVLKFREDIGEKWL